MVKCKKCKTIYSSDVFKSCPICELGKSIKNLSCAKNKIDWVEVFDGYLVEIGTGEYRIDANEELQRRIMKALNHSE